MKLGRLIKMCLNETYGRVRVDKNLSDMFRFNNGLKKGDALSSLLFNFDFEHTIWRIQVNKDGLKSSGTYQLLVYTGDVNMLGGSLHTLRKNTEALVVASMETGLEVNAAKTKYMVMSRNQNAGRSYNIKTDNSSFRRVEEFKYLLTILTQQNSIHEETTSILKSGNACYHSVQNVLSSSLLSKKSKDLDIQYYNFACCFVRV
jgi:hypothetical protein